MDLTLPVLGLDVSKATLDVKLSSDKQRRLFKRVANTLDGLEQLQGWLEAHSVARVHVCLEATGTYHDLAALFFFERGHQVSVLNPARVKAFRISEGMVSKTDRQDALLLARFGEQKRPGLWKPTPALIEQMQVLLGRLDDRAKMQRQESNRLENGRLDEETRREIMEHVAWVERMRKQCKRRVLTLVAGSHEPSPEAGEQQEPMAGGKPATPVPSSAPTSASPSSEQVFLGCQVLASLPGIGALTAARLYSVYWDHERFGKAGSLVHYAGISPAHNEAGTSVRGAACIARAGNADVRRWLYMCAIVATTHDPDFRHWKQELQARGKKGWVILTAVMRKLLHLVHGVLKSGEAYDAHKAWPTHYRDVQEEKHVA